jgi:hypothetical protein
MPDFGRDVKRFEVDCPRATTGLTHPPVPALGQTDEVLILAAAYAHEERCGACDVGAVLDRGGQQLRDAAERASARFQERRRGPTWRGGGIERGAMGRASIP